ncbi:pentatricopeptide repeat-containing protein At3g16610-like isoform X1 [Phoenix dactylifera]|uniref:Pentatricopeptide repeat-containing protein At3g16610-like isoform X1 n=1 Tax=Phoenix dactylifera TaxID=42345 RepID=A0A8B8ZX49_PHODC|nr:pentatricopeptide repeat-containing protein At3g16610-like isoform X2 [Phoenix dactylifera]XP_038975909.1 pentatricopeptide repeat-containing protein At3g16610-like isoform X1 [Phoenix dactylifera]
MARILLIFESIGGRIRSYPTKRMALLRRLNHLHTQSRSNLIIRPPNNRAKLSSIETTLKTLRLRNSPGDVSTYCKLLDTCIRSKSWVEVKKIHHHILNNSAHITNPSLLERIALAYISCNEIEQARVIFDQIPQPSVFLWNAMIRAYSWKGPFDRAIDLYHRMVDCGIKPNKFTFPFVLKACSGLAALEEGIQIHNHGRRVGLDSDLFVGTALVDMYMKCGCLDDAHEVFNRMPKRDVVAWNAMVTGYALHGMYEEMVGFVLEMQKMGTSPNSSTLVAILPVVGQVQSLKQGKSIHGFCVRRCFHEEDVLVGTALLDMYAKCEYLNYAWRIFDSMTVRNEVTWSAMIGGYVLCDRVIEALWVFDQMMLEGSTNVSPSSFACILRACASFSDSSKGTRVHCYVAKFGYLSDISVSNSLLSMYAKVGSLDDALRFFNEMDPKDTVSYSAIISGCVQNGNAKEALNIFRNMQLSSIEPDAATMVGVLPACSHLAALQHGKCAHGYVTVYGLASEISICNALIDVYAKCGRIDLAREVFDRMSKQDIVSWNTLITGYGIHGLGNEAILLFYTMVADGLLPDDITFICLISACSHSGLVTEGKHWFHAMSQIYGINPRMEHYICMVDLLGRGGFLDEANDLIQKMPFEPDVRVWGALLGACRVHENIELGEKVSKVIHKLGPEGTGNFVLLSNIYSAAGRFDEAAQVRNLQRDKGFKKTPGCSWVEIKGTVHAFIGGDQSHPQSSSIHQKLEDLLVQIKKLGYQADTSFVLQDIEQEDKEHALLYHSEKLAIAFAVLNLRSNEPIFVTKNLRVCGDCHTAIKYITLVTKRAITIRDANRFHHFKDGLCNCGDFW